MTLKDINFNIAMYGTEPVVQSTYSVVYTGDESSINLRFAVTDEPDLEGATAIVHLKFADSSHIERILELLTESVFSYTLKGTENKHSGVVRADIIITKGDAKFTRAGHKFKIDTSLDASVPLIEYAVDTLDTLVDGAEEWLLQTQIDFGIAQSQRAEEWVADNDARADEFAESHTDRTNAFDASEAARTTDFNASETGRSNTFTVNENAREAAAESGEAARGESFELSEYERATTFGESEAGRVITFNGSEADRTIAFNLAEAARSEGYTKDHDRAGTDHTRAEYDHDIALTDQENYDTLLTNLQETINDANENIAEFDVALQNGIVATNIAAELQNLEETYAPNIVSITSQLAEIENTKAEQTALNVEKARIDSFTTLASGSTTGDAELIDGRVGSDGVTYLNIGAAIRGQVDDLNSNLNEIRDKTTKNSATGKTIIDNFYYVGYEEANTSYLYIKEIPVVAGKTYISNLSARYVAFLDDSKTYIANSLIRNVSSFTPTVDGYLNVTYAKNVFTNAKIYSSEYSAGEVEDYGVYSISVYAENVLSDLKGINNLTLGMAVVQGRYFSSYDDVNGLYSYIKEIPIVKDQTYALSNSARYISFLDSSKAYSSRVENTNIFTAPIDGYVNITLLNTRFINVKLHKIELAENEVADYGENEYPTIAYINSSEMFTREQNPLYGKKWAVCGDSFTNGDFANAVDTDFIITDGIYKGKNKVYDYLIGNRNLMDIQHMAVGGRTLATPANMLTHNCFSDTGSTMNYTTIDPDVDFITLYFGINDSHNAPGSAGGDGEVLVGEIPLGSISDTTINTFYGAWNVVIPYLIQNHPNAHIGIIVSNGCDSDDYRLATIAIANKYGIPYIDLNGDERTPMMIRSTNPVHDSAMRTLRTQQWTVNYGVNYHPSAKAHEYESTFMESWLKTI